MASTKKRWSSTPNLETMPTVISNQVSAIPRTPWVDSSQDAADSAVKSATPDIILWNDDMIPEEAMVDTILENIAGQELLLSSRNDIIGGQTVVYQPIKNLSKIALRYNSKNLLPLQNPSDVIFNNFPISFEKSVPLVGTGPNGESIYIEENTGDLVINVVSLNADEQIEVQILSTGSVLDDTIYVEENS